MKEIKLTKNYTALVDDEDFERLNKYKWHVTFTNNSTPYAKTGTFGKSGSYYMHRLILGCKKGECVDHINKNGLDNRRCNLRIVNKSQNSMNLRKRSIQLGEKLSSKFKGVCFNKRDNIWMAYGNIDGKRTYLGTFKTEIEAARAYNQWATIHYKEFAQLNLIE